MREILFTHFLLLFSHIFIYFGYNTIKTKMEE